MTGFTQTATHQVKITWQCPHAYPALSDPGYGAYKFAFGQMSEPVDITATVHLLIPLFIRRLARGRWNLLNRTDHKERRIGFPLWQAPHHRREHT